MRNGMKSRTPGEAPGQRIRGAAFPWWVLGTVLVLAFGLWHLRDVRAGVIETGDAFLYGWYGLLMAGATLVLIPVLLVFVFAQRFFVQGIATSGMKN